MQAREAVIGKWARYCTAFGLAPKSLIGKSHPGSEDFQMDDRMAREVEALSRTEQPGQTVRTE